MKWIRLETGVVHHPKVMELRARKQYRAAMGFLLSLALSGAQESDGHITKSSLVLLDLTTKEANQLVDVGLWNAVQGGYEINDWAEYNPALYYEGRKKAGKKGACSRWHGPNCARPSCQDEPQLRAVDNG